MLEGQAFQGVSDNPVAPYIEITTEWSEPFDHDDRRLVDAVVRGEKPACIIPSYSILQSELDDLISIGFDCLPSVLAETRDFGILKLKEASPLELVVIARKGKSRNLIDSFEMSAMAGVESINGMKERLSSLRDLIRDMSIAEALLFLSDYTRENEEANLENPEVAVIEGILLDYRACDIEYFVLTRYGFIPRSKEEASGGLGPNVLCPPCSSRMI